MSLWDETTQNEKDVLAYKVENPKGWCDHAESHAGIERATEAMKEKVARWQGDMDAAVGEDKNRLTRDAAGEKAVHESYGGGDLATAKRNKKKIQDEQIGIFYKNIVDAHYNKKRRREDRGLTTYTIPQDIKNYEDGLKTVGDLIEAEINALTTVESVSRYSPGENGATPWPIPPYFLSGTEILE
jgi:hypothetical protein